MYKKKVLKIGLKYDRETSFIFNRVKINISVKTLT